MTDEKQNDVATDKSGCACSVFVVVNVDTGEIDKSAQPTFCGDELHELHFNWDWEEFLLVKKPNSGISGKISMYTPYGVDKLSTYDRIKWETWKIDRFTFHI